MPSLEDNLRTEVAFVKRLLLGLHQLSFNKFCNREGGWSDARILDVLEKLQMFGSKEWLEDRLPSDHRQKGRLLSRSHLLFLDFVDKDNTLPILDMVWDLQRRPVEEIRFRFFLLHWENNDRPRAVGFRLEAPEGPGSHDYWHGQMIAEFEKGDAQHIQKLIGEEIPRWIPRRQPAFPLPAKSMGDLLAVLLLSLYGLKQLRTFSELDGFGELSERLRQMDILPS
jgi:hypothetical protein